MKAMKAVILAGGKGQRLWPVTASYPKPYVKILGIPIIQWMIYFLRSNGVKDIIVITNPSHKINIGYFDYTVKKKDEITSSIDFLKKLDVTPVIQDEPKGTAHALWCAREYIDDDFILLNGDDIIFPYDVAKVVREEGFYVSHVDDRRDYGAVIVEEGRLLGIREKTESGPGMINLNLAHLPKEFMDYVDIEKLKPSSRGEYEIADVFNRFANDHELKVREVTSWQTVTYFWNLIDVQRRFIREIFEGKLKLKELNEFGEFDGFYLEKKEKNMIIHNDAEVSEHSDVKGSFLGPGVRIEKFAKVYDSVLEGFNRVGTSEIKRSVIMKGTNVPHFNYVGDSVLCEHVNLGAGTKLANLRFDEASVQVQTLKGRIDSGRRKLGSCIGANTKLGVNVSVNCGVLIAPNIHVLPQTFVKRNILGKVLS